jgi:methionine-rich copper-binding protein CopC
MNRSLLAGLVALAALAPLSLAQAQASPHAGMSPQEHAAMQAAPASGIVTTPADNAMLNAAPTTFSATFPHAMTLKSLTLTGPATQTVNVEIAASTAPQMTVSTPLPRLAPGNYSAAWTATGADGHEMNGTVRFMVH